MKKIVIIVVIIFIVIASMFFIKPKKDIKVILSNYESSENDGFGDEGGYIVSKKTSNGYRYGYINYKGKLILNLEYSMIHRISEIGGKGKVYLIAVKDGRYGVKLNEKTIINHNYQFIDYNSNSEVFVLNRNNKFGVANLKGEIIIDVDKKNVEAKGIYIYVEDNENKYVCNNKGDIIDIDFNTNINKTENKKYYIKTVYRNEDYRYNISDALGNDILKNDYDYLEYVFGDYFIFGTDDGKQGIIDVNGNVKLDSKYTLVQKIQNTHVIRTLDRINNETELYSSELEKICTMKNATITISDNEIKIYNQDDEIKLDFNGNIK